MKHFLINDNEHQCVFERECNVEFYVNCTLIDTMHNVIQVYKDSDIALLDMKKYTPSKGLQ